jgi:colanic acid/amylovoran biosynthesis glycosyltransferase
MTAILVYRDRLVAPSEALFLRRQYAGFETLTAHWVGRRRDPQSAGAGLSPIFIGGEGPLRPLRQTLFTQFGLVSEPALTALRPALVHAQFGKGGALALPLARAFEIPLVVTFHGADAFKDRHYRPFALGRVFPRRWRALCDYASLFVCVSSGVRDALAARGAPAAKLAVIPIGVDGVSPDPGRAAPRHFLFAGRFVEKKGVFVAVEAARRLRAEGDETPIVLAGDGPLRPEAERHAAGLRHIEFAGWLAPDRLKAKMAEATALITPSLQARSGDREGLPSVAVEAMGLGVPVIASDQAGLEGVVENDRNGLVTRAGDSGQLAAAMARFAVEPALRDRLGDAAHRLVATDYRAEAQSRRLEMRLLEIIAQRAR